MCFLWARTAAFKREKARAIRTLGILGPCSIYSVYCPAHLPLPTRDSANGSARWPELYNLVLWGLSSNCFHRLPCPLTLARSASSLSLVYTFLTCLSCTLIPTQNALSTLSQYPTQAPPPPRSPPSFLNFSSPHKGLSPPFLVLNKCPFPPPPGP